MPIAPVNMNVPQPRLSDVWNQPTEGSTRLPILPNLDVEKVPGFLSELLTLLDPSGMVGAPAGLVFGKGVPQLVREIGTSAEEFSPMLKSMTRTTPVKQMGVLESRPGTVAEYISSSPLRPAGNINLYGQRDPRAVLEEMGHRLGEHPTSKDLMYDLWMKAPVGTEKSLTARGYKPSEFREEYFAKSIAGTLEEALGKSPSRLSQIITEISDIKAPSEMKAQLLEFLKSVPENKQQETVDAFTKIFGKSEPIGKQGVKEQKDALKNKEIMDLIRDEIGKVIQRPGKGGVISSKKGGGMIVNKPGELGQYLEETPRPTSYDPETGARRWEF